MEERGDGYSEVHLVETRQRSCVVELGGDLGEVLHMWAADDGRRERRRLDHVMAAAFGQGPAHEDQGGEAEQPVEFADRVQQQDPIRGPEHRPAGEPDARRIELSRRRVEPFRPPRHEDQQ